MLEVSTCSSISDSVGLDLSLALESGEWSTVRYATYYVRRRTFFELSRAK